MAGHGVDASVVEPAYAAARAFFALSEEEKGRYTVVGGAGERGYSPFGAEHAKDSPKPDLKEFWHTGRELDADASGPVTAACRRTHLLHGARVRRRLRHRRRRLVERILRVGLCLPSMENVKVRDGRQYNEQ